MYALTTARLGIDACNVIGHPDVREDLALHVFELVQVFHRLTEAGHPQTPTLRK